MAKIKSKFVKVICASIVSGHRVTLIKLRTLEPLEVLRYDPQLQMPFRISGLASKVSVMRHLTRNLRHFQGNEKYLNLQLYRSRKGLGSNFMCEGPLLDGPDWCYADGSPGMMNKGQSERYVRDQDMGRYIVENDWVYNPDVRNKKK